jgi:hypothetical protein
MSVIYIRKAYDDPIIAVADRMAPRLRQAFLDAVAAAGSSLSIKAIADAIDKGDSARVIELLDGRFRSALEGIGLTTGTASVRDAVQATFAASAKAAAGQLPSKISTELSFNMLNPEAVRAIERYTFDLIREITADTRQAIQQVVLRAFREGGHPYEQAREIKGLIGLTARQERAIANYRSALESGQASDLRAALDRALRDGRYDRSLLRAIEEQQGLPAAKVDALVERYRARYVQYRAQTIARTESIRASSAGRRELWRQAKEQGLLDDDARRRWISSGDDRECDVCSGLDDEEAGLDEEFSPGIMEPPDPHPDCRCSLSLVFGKTA